MISIIIPTVPGREDHYERCLAAYHERTGPVRLEIITEVDHATVGLAWQAGAEKATGDYIHLTCDDLEPLDGWDVAAVKASDAGVVPAPRVTDARTGQLQSWPAWGREHDDGTDAGFSAIPFLSRAMWEVVRPLFTGHYLLLRRLHLLPGAGRRLAVPGVQRVRVPASLGAAPPRRRHDPGRAAGLRPGPIRPGRRHGQRRQVA
jgi:hypothetical protein